MTNEFIFVNELLSLAACPIALLTSALVPKKTEKLLIQAHVASFIFSLLAAVATLMTAGAPPVMAHQILIIDPATSCLLVTAFFISAIVIAYSDRYLSGDETRARFMQHVSFISSAAVLLIATDSMLVAFFCWLSSSIGLWMTIRLQPSNARVADLVLKHHLAGDVVFLFAILLCVSYGEVVQFSDLTQNLKLLNVPVMTSSGAIGLLITSLLVLSFGIKSALFPFHRWLLLTLEAPTPLSGLLHAGVVNVSAIMAWRFMPLMQEYAAPLLVWGIWSGISAIVGTLSMSTQPDVKRKLAYSTVGQMGFMSLQCATGAIAAALFHLVAHGLFKCHLFLQSGSAVSEGLTKRKFNYAGHLPAVGQNIIILGFLVFSVLAMNYLRVFTDSSLLTVMSTLVMGAAVMSVVPSLNRIDVGMLLLFFIGVVGLAIPSMVAGINLEGFVRGEQQVNAWLLPAFLLTYFSIAIFQAITKHNSFAEAVYVHSLNGFYIDDAFSILSGRKERSKNAVDGAAY